MKTRLTTQYCYERLVRNGQARCECDEKGDPSLDLLPVVKLFMPHRPPVGWLVTEIDPANEDIGYGLCVYDFEPPHLGSISFSELAALRGPDGPLVRTDLGFDALFPISVYLRSALRKGRIVEDRATLEQAAKEIL